MSLANFCALPKLAVTMVSGQGARTMRVRVRITTQSPEGFVRRLNSLG